MPNKPVQPQVAGAKRRRKHKRPIAPAPNAALNQQNRRVLAQHYRAKYGVK